MNQANLCEVFTSIQGEGIFAGRVQLFIRFSGCNINCYYCDTKDSLDKTQKALLEIRPLSGKFKSILNPVGEDILISYVKNAIKKYPTHSISITGGEPLLQVDFLESFLMKIRRIKPIHLETNGTLPDNLNKILKYVDFISMDFKPDYFKNKGFIVEQTKFLKISSKKLCQVKIVITKKLSESYFLHSISIMQEVNKKIPLILQPNSKELSEVKSKLFKFYKIASHSLENVLILPQIHLLMDLK